MALTETLCVQFQTGSTQVVKFQQIEVKTPRLVRPSMTAPQLLSRSQTELTLRWDPWIPKQQDDQSSAATVEYALEWQQGSGQDGFWSTVPGVFEVCEVTRRNLKASTPYSFRVRARMVHYIGLLI